VNFSAALKEWTRVYDLESPPIPIHRLDKPTTGVLLLARNDRSARNLAREFRERNIDKTYLALVNSSASSILKTKSAGTIKHPLLVDGNGRVGLHGGDRELGSEDVVREAHTDWELLGVSSRYPVTLLKIKLHTGVKHQIRIHAARVLEAPIIGDFLYCKSHKGSIPKPVIPNPGGAMHLHASNVSLYRYNKEGPNKRFRLGITAPLPRPFRDVCELAGIVDKIPDEMRWESLWVDGTRVDSWG